MSCLRKVDFHSLFFSKGQVTVEYILLIVVVIAIALGIGGPLGKYLRDFSGALVGPEGYYACLTREGLLPGAPTSAPCGKYADLALGHLGGISTGINPGGPGSGGGPGSNNNPNLGSNPSADNPSGSDTDTDSSSDSTSGSNSDSRSKMNSRRKNKRSSRHKLKNRNSSSSLSGVDPNSSGASSGNLSNRDSAFPALSVEGKSGKKKDKKGGSADQLEDVGLEENSFDSKKGRKRKPRVKIRRRGSGAYLGNRMDVEEEEENKPVFKVQPKSGKTGNDFVADSKKNRRALDKKGVKDIHLEEEESGFGFGKILKYLVIAAVIVAVIIVIFSQIMEYQSRD